MQLDKISNFGNLITKFRQYDTNKDGYISAEEDKEVKNLDLDRDNRASLWELMTRANAQQPKAVFTKAEINNVKESIQNMPDISPANILHIILAIEKRFICQRDMQQIYPLFNSLIRRIKQEDINDLTPENKMNRVYQILKDEYKFRMIRCKTRNIQRKTADIFGLLFLKRRFDCGSFAFTLMVIGQELNWPLSLIELPYHMAVKWEEGKESFTFERDQGAIKDFEKKYKDFFKIRDASIKSGAYLRSLSEQELVAEIYLRRGIVKRDFLYEWAAIEDYSIAISLAPFNVLAYHARANSYDSLSSNALEFSPLYYKQIILDSHMTERLDPDFFSRTSLDNIISNLPECKD